ncbi:MAG: fibronectin type III domain-containing protein, partial [Elusimicrobiota bacterium]
MATIDLFYDQNVVNVVDATLVTTTLANTVYYINTGLSPATLYYYRVKATNAAGDSGWSTSASARTNSGVLVVDTISPEVSIVNYQDGATVFGIVPIEIKATDASGINSVEIYIDDV